MAQAALDVPDPCIARHRTVLLRQEAIQCDVCRLWQHRIYNTGISRQIYRQAVRGIAELQWVCDICYTLESSISVPLSPTPPRSPTPMPMSPMPLTLIPRSPTPPRSPILMDMSDSDRLSLDLNESPLLDPTPIDGPTTAHEVQYKIVSETSIRGSDKVLTHLAIPTR